MKKLILFANFLFLVNHLSLGQEIVSSSGEFIKYVATDFKGMEITGHTYFHLIQ
jgi:hypothetical protein